MQTKSLKAIFVFVCGGLIFSGYLSGVKFFTDTCAFNESCPYFLGYPACWYGFGMYFAMFVTATLFFLNKITFDKALNVVTLISFVGIVFAGNFAVREFMLSQFTGVLGLSTCVYGLIFYIAIFVLSLLKRG